MSLDTALLIATSAVTAAAVLLRVIAPLTKSTKDDWVLGKLEWLLAVVFVPGKYKASLGGGKGGHTA
jgi:hypothetical protein